MLFRSVVASKHVVDSFRFDESALGKLFLDPYGVDLAMFPQREPRPAASPMNLLYVGAWSLRKGCDLLAEAVRRTPGVVLTHVGSVSDAAFPNEPRFVRVGAVPQHDLSRHFHAADAFVLASREDGFGVVLSQALASGLSVICTDRTGGLDLAFSPALAERIVVVPHENIDALANAIAALRDRLAAGRVFAALPSQDRETLSWTAYGRRYDDELRREFATA